MPLDIINDSPSGQPFLSMPATDLCDLLGRIETHQDLSTEAINRETADNCGCDIPLTVSLFADVKARQIEPNHLSLRQLQKRLTDTTAPDKAALPLVKLATFGDALTEKGSLRHDANLLAVSGVEGDYDAGAVSPQQAAEWLKLAGIAALIYTTPSHTAETPRWRVLAPLAAQVRPTEREALCGRLNGALKGVLAAESFVTSQSYYFGGVTGRPLDSYLVEGQPLDCVTGITPIGPQPKTAKSATDLSDLFKAPADRNAISAALNYITIEKGDYFLWVEIGQALHAEFNGNSEGFNLWHDWSKSQPGYKDERDLKSKWRGFKSGGGITIETLFYHAKVSGYCNVTDDDFDDLSPLPETDKTQPSPLTFLTPNDCERAPSRGYLIKGLFAPGDVACIFGAPGAGKSLIAPFLGYMVAQGTEAFGMRTKAGGVFYVAAEDSHGMRGRVTALKLAHGDAPNFKLVDGVSRLLPAAGEKRAPDLQALLDAAKAQRPALIFIDTLAIAFGSFEENSAEAMNQIVRIARALTTWGAAVVLIHHDTKSEGGTPRGHSVLNGALDVALHVKRDDEYKIIRGRLTKNRNGSCERDIAFAITTEDFGFDEDGDALTFPRCNPLAGAPSKVKRLPPAEQAALDLLERLGGRLSEADFKEALVNGREVSASDNPKSRRDVVGRSIKALVQKKRIIFNNGFYSTRDGFDDLPEALGAALPGATTFSN